MAKNNNNNIKLNVIFLLFVSTTIKFIKCEPTTSKYSYNSSDLSYLSNGIQFPVPSSESLQNIAALLKNDTVQEMQPVMEWFSGLYNHLKWQNNINLENPKCKSEMLTYIQGLQNGTSWAAKMFDASGRYSGQFFFGNDFWIGSSDLCKELTNSATNAETPPFAAKFFVAKIRININQQLTPVTRQLNLGQCLPSSCGIGDIRQMLAQERNQAVSVNIVGVRAVPGNYSLWKDLKFHILGSAVVIVGAIIILASIVEILLKKNVRKHKENDSEIQNNNNNSIAESIKTRNGSTETVLSNNSSKDYDSKKTSNKKSGVLLDLLLCFSALTNGKKILNVNKLSKDSITCIHGLRFFSIAWIILVHTYLEVFALADNKTMRIITERSFTYQTISNATFSVDTFFFISGLLVTITYFRSAAKKEKPKEDNLCKTYKTNFLKFVILITYRFFRLTPAYLFVLGVNELVLRYAHNYSVFSPAIVDHITCDKFWWRNALYINNFYPQTEYCMLWSWYISNDTQFYLIAVTLLLIAVRGEKQLKFAAGAIGAFMVSSWITTFIIAMKYEYVARVEEPFALFDQLYDKPWLRIGPYLVGMVSGYFLFKVNCKITIPPYISIIGWILSLSCLISLVYGLGRQGLVVPASAFYASLGHTAWGLALAWITICCCTGYGGPLNSFFSCRLFLPLSRLTYCAYLIHPVLMVLSSFLLDGPIHLHNVMAIVMFFGNVVISFIAAFLISLAFEAPVVGLLRITFGANSKNT